MSEESTGSVSYSHNDKFMVRAALLSSTKNVHDPQDVYQQEEYKVTITHHQSDTLGGSHSELISDTILDAIDMSNSTKDDKDYQDTSLLEMTATIDQALMIVKVFTIVELAALSESDLVLSNQEVQALNLFIQANAHKESLIILLEGLSSALGGV